MKDTPIVYLLFRHHLLILTLRHLRCNMSQIMCYESINSRWRFTIVGDAFIRMKLGYRAFPNRHCRWREKIRDPELNSG